MTEIKVGDIVRFQSNDADIRSRMLVGEIESRAASPYLFYIIVKNRSGIGDMTYMKMDYQVTKLSPEEALLWKLEN